MVFLPAFGEKGYADNDTTYTGIQMITGLTVFDVGVIADGKIPFSFLALMAFALPVIAGIWHFLRIISSSVMFIAGSCFAYSYSQVHVVNIHHLLVITELEIDWVLTNWIDCCR